jgi:GntR family transcriptional regulator, transcriptional repressor for pyruvate dehydrogenase complex
MKVSDEVCIKLQKAIFKGEYKPHSRFPSERELAETYQVSRSVIREAVARLAQLGLVETRPQSGTYVSDFQTEGSIDLLIHIMKSNEVIDSETLISLLKIRRMAESFMSYEAALQATPDEVASLKEAGEALIKTIRTRPDDIRQLSEHDFNFHATLARASRNLVSQLLFNSFKPMYKYYADYYYSMPDTHQVTIQFVMDLLGAVTDKDGDRAETVMREAIIFSEDRLIETLGLKETNRTISLRSRR